MPASVSGTLFAMRLGAGYVVVAVGAAATLWARPARADGAEIEARAGSLTQDFHSYDLGAPVTVGWASLVAFDASLRYYIPYVFAGLTAGYAFSVVHRIEGARGASVDSNARLWTAGLELGSHLRAGQWAFRPSVVGGVHSLHVSTGSEVCTHTGVGANSPIVPCDKTAAGPNWYVQPRFSVDRRVSDLVYVGALVGLDVPTAGPVGQLVIGVRAPEEPPPTVEHPKEGRPTDRREEAPLAAARPKGPRPFDRGAAAAAFRLDFSACRDPGGPFGDTHVRVKFEPDGAVSEVTFDGPGDPFQGTAAGECIVRLLRSISVPPFDSPPVFVGRTITLHE